MALTVTLTIHDADAKKIEEVNAVKQLGELDSFMWEITDIVDEGSGERTKAVGDKAQKVLILTQEYGSKLIDAAGYNLLDEIDKEEKLKKEGSEILVEIAKVLKNE